MQIQITNPQALESMRLYEHVYVSVYVERPVVAAYMGQLWDVLREENGDWELLVLTNPEETDDTRWEWRSYYFDVFGFPLAGGGHPAFFVATRAVRE